MINFLKNIKAIVFGILITALITLILWHFKFIIIDETAITENLIIFSVWWLIVSIIIHNFNFFRSNKVIVYKVLFLLLVFIVAVIIDLKLNMPDNPITVTFLVLFWIGVCYLIVPKFFMKYRIPILLIYGGTLSYFIYVRLGYDTSIYFKEYKENVINLLLIPIPVIALLYFFEQWKWLKHLKAKKDKAELTLLKSQINPHFFFNTLNNLYGLTVEKSDKAPEVVLKLSDMMRYTIYEGKKDFVSLKDEISYLESYIELHKIRFQKRADIKFNYDLEKDYQITPLLFIVMLENAFKHGVESLMEDAYIHVDIKANSNKIVFQIENNFEEKDIEHHKGIGLSNLKERLEITYPNKHKLIIEETKHTYKAMLELNTQ